MKAERYFFMISLAVRITAREKDMLPPGFKSCQPMFYGNKWKCNHSSSRWVSPIKEHLPILCELMFGDRNFVSRTEGWLSNAYVKIVRVNF